MAFSEAFKQRNSVMRTKCRERTPAELSRTGHREGSPRGRTVQAGGAGGRTDVGFGGTPLIQLTLFPGPISPAS